MHANQISKCRGGKRCVRSALWASMRCLQHNLSMCVYLLQSHLLYLSSLLCLYLPDRSSSSTLLFLYILSKFNPFILIGLNLVSYLIFCLVLYLIFCFMNIAFVLLSFNNMDFIAFFSSSIFFSRLSLVLDVSFQQHIWGVFQAVIFSLFCFLTVFCLSLDKLQHCFLSSHLCTIWNLNILSSPPFPSALSVFHHRGLFQSAGSFYQVAKVLEVQL